MGSDGAGRDLCQHSARRDLYGSAGFLRCADGAGDDSGAADLRRGDRVPSEPDRALRRQPPAAAAGTEDKVEARVHPQSEPCGGHLRQRCCGSPDFIRVLLHAAAAAV